MAGVRAVLRSRDHRWRIEILDDGRVNLVYLGALVLAGVNMDGVGRHLAREGVDPGDFVED